MDSCDLLVVGGGILGAACAREAALDGRSVVLVESGDIAGGTSSASSKLVHGGLRYLEHGDLRLVREAVLERADLLRTANHLVEPLDFVLPLVPESRHGGIATRLALTAYDALAWPRGIGRHRRLPPAELLSRLPHLRTEGLHGGFLYRDARMDDARLCLEVLFDARALGVEVRPRTRLSGLVRESETGDWKARLVSASGTTSLAARRVLLCVGPWTDALLAELGIGTDDPLVSPSRGDHLVFPDWGLEQAAILPEPDSDRFFFLIPWQGQVLVGTTEDPWSPGEGDPLPMAAGRIQGWLRRYFPTLEIRPHASFSGVRPLAHAPGTPLHKASREHRLVRVAPDCHALVGGKYTTFRAIAESARGVWDGRGSSKSPGRLLPGAWPSSRDRQEAKDLVASWGLGGRTARWIDRYGRRVGELADAIAECREAGIDEGRLAPSAEILHAMRAEWAGSLLDVAARRTLDALRPDRGEILGEALVELHRTRLVDLDPVAEREALRLWCARRPGAAP